MLLFYIQSLSLLREFSLIDFWVCITLLDGGWFGVLGGSKRGERKGPLEFWILGTNKETGTIYIYISLKSIKTKKKVLPFPLFATGHAKPIERVYQLTKYDIPGAAKVSSEPCLSCLHVSIARRTIL